MFGFKKKLKGARLIEQQKRLSGWEKLIDIFSFCEAFQVVVGSDEVLYKEVYEILAELKKTYWQKPYREMYEISRFIEGEIRMRQSDKYRSYSGMFLMKASSFRLCLEDLVTAFQ